MSNRSRKENASYGRSGPEAAEPACPYSEGGSREQKASGASEVDARQGATDQGMKDKLAQETTLHKDQYPQIQEDTSIGSAQASSQASDAGTSEQSG